MGCQKVKEKHVAKNCLQGYSQAWNMSEAINISKLCKMKRSSNFCFIGCYKTLFYGFEGNNLFKYELHNQSLIMKWLWRYSTWEGGVYFLGGLVGNDFFFWQVHAIKNCSRKFSAWEVAIEAYQGSKAPYNVLTFVRL